jgi:hypothetical protein
LGRALLAMRPLHSLLAVLALWFLLLASGCGFIQVPTRVYVNEGVLAIRYDVRSNVVERLVKKEKMREYYVPLSVEPPQGYSYKMLGRSVVLEKPNQKSVTCEGLDGIESSNRLFSSWFTEYWCFRPVSGTNLWTAIALSDSRFYGPYGSERWKSEAVDLKVYLFDTKRILSARQLRTFAPRALDSSNQHFSYKSGDGYEVYDILKDTAEPSSQPSAWRELTLRDFGGKEQP